jgi:hypothetical protein
VSITVSASATFAADAAFGPSFTGLNTVGVRILDAAGATSQARTTSGVVESPAGSGDYVKTFSAPATPGNYRLVWDTGGGSPQWAIEDLIVTSQAVSTPTPPLTVRSGMNTLYVGDRNPSLGPVPLLRRDGSAVDLTGFTSMKFTLRGEYDTANLFTPAAAPMLDPTVSGVTDARGVACWGVRYDWGAGDLANAASGIYLGQWIGVDANGHPQHYAAGRYMIVRGF